MRFKPVPINSQLGCLTIAIACCSAGTARATNYSKANNNTNLNLTASWSTGVVPTSADIGQWDSTVSTAINCTNNLGAVTNWAGIKIVGPAAPVTITNSATALTLGASGIDLSAATQGLNIFTPLVLGASQTWNIASGQILNVGGVVSGATGNLLTVSGSGLVVMTGANTYSGGTAISGGRLVVSGAVAPAGNYNIFNGAILEITAPTVNPLSNATTFTNAGTLKLDGGSATAIIFNASGNDTVALAAGGLVQVSSNTTVTASSGYHGIWSANLGSLQVDSGSTINFVETGSSTAGTQAQFDALNGGGNITMGYLTYRTLSLGNANGSGTFTGNIGDANTSNGSTTALVKNGTGTQILSGNSGYTAGTTINAGILEADSNTALGGGTVKLNGGTLSNNVSATLANGVNINTASTIGVGNGQAFTLGGVITNSAAVTKTGAGTLTLSGANTYSGLTTVSGGELRVTTAGSANSTITVASGATNGVLVYNLGGQWTSTGSLTNQNGSIWHLNYSSFLPSTTVAPLKVANLTLGSSLTLRIDGAASAFYVGQSYPLATWTAAGPATATGFSTLLLPAGVAGNLSVTGSTLYLNVTGNTSQLTWNNGNGPWDTTSTTNWVNSALTGSAYVDSASGVVFDDASGATGNPTITLNSAFSPLGVLMKSTSHNYTISGTGGIGGSAALLLDPANSMTLTLATANTYTGGTTIGGGALTISGAGSLGGGSYAGAITDNGILSYNSSVNQTLSGVIQGTGSLNYSGPGSLSLSAANTFSGGTSLTNGTLTPGNALCYGTGTVTINATATSYAVASLTFANPVILNGGTWRIGGGASHQLSASGSFSVTANSSVFADGSTGYGVSGQTGGDWGSAIFLNGSLNMGSNGLTLSTFGQNGVTINGSISGANGTIINTSGGTYLWLANSSNSFAGTIRSQGGWVILGYSGANSFYNATVDMNAADAGSFQISSYPFTIGGLMGSRNLTLAGGVSIGANNSSTTYSGVLTNSGLVTKIGLGTLTLAGANNNFVAGLIINGGTLALTGSGSLAGTNIVVANNGIFNVSGLTGPFTLGSTQVFSNSAPGAIINGTNNCSAGKLSLVYDGINPSLLQTNGGMTLSAATVITVNNTGAQLAAGAHIIIAAATAGNPGKVAGSLPSVTVTGNGAAGAVSLKIDAAGNLDLIVAGAFEWTGTSSTSWGTAGNWSAGTIPSAGTNVVFDALSSANLATVLDTGYNLNSLSVISPTGPVSIGGASTLSLTNGINLAYATQPLTMTAPLMLGASQSWTVTNQASLSANGGISGSATLSLAGGGTVSLGGADTYTGGTKISGGTTLKFTGASSIPSAGTIYVANTTTTGTIDLGGLTQTCGGYVAFPYTSTTTLTNGTLICNSANSLVPNANPEYQWLGTINLAPNGNYLSNQRLLLGYNYNGFALTINGTGTNGSFTFGGDNNSNENYVGAIANDAATLNINGGTVNFNNATYGTGNGYVNVGANSASAKGTITVNGGSLNIGTWLKLGGIYNSIAGQTSTSALTVTNGAVTVGGGSDATYNGVLFLDGGNGDNTANTGVATLTLNNAALLTVAQIQAGNQGTNTINLNGGTLVAGLGASNLFLSAATKLTVNVQNGGVTINSGTNSIIIGAALTANGTGGLTKTGNGILTLTGTNTYTGATIINAGALTIYGAGTLGGGAYGLAITDNGALNFNSSSSQTLSGIISGTGGLNALGAGTLTLSANNTYSGATTISGGTLVLSGGSLLTNSASIVVASNAVFNVAGLSSAFTLAASLSSQSFSNSAPGAIINGAINCAMGTLSLVYNGANSSFTVTNGTMSLSAATTINVYNNGASLAPGIYKLIAKATVGNVGLVSGTVPSYVTVVGGPGAGTPSLSIVGGELYLTVGAVSSISYSAAGPFTYDGLSQSPTVSFSGSTAARTATYVGTGTTTYSSIDAPTNAGTYYVSNTVAADANYFGAASSQAFTISAVPAAVAANPLNKDYGDANPPLTAAVTGTIGGDTLNYTLATMATPLSDVGVSNITITLGSNPNYIVLTTNSTLTINAKAATVSANPLTKSYGAINPALTATVVGQVIGGDPINYTLVTDATQFSGVGVSNVTVTLGSNPNYSVLTTNSTLTITAATTVFTALSSVTNSYGTTNIVLSGTLSDGGVAYPANGEAVSATINGYTVSGTVTNGTGNFSIDYSDPSLVTNGVAGSPLAITYNYAGNDNLAAAADSTTSLVITNALLLITANNDSKTYDGNAYVTNQGVTYAGFVNGETIAVLGGTLVYGGTSQGATNAGSYWIVPSGLTSTNYAINYTNGTLTVNPLAIGVVADVQTKVYGVADSALTYTFSPALVGSDSFSGSLVRVAGENVGNYAINQGTLGLSANYSLNYIGANLTITAANLTITANGASKTYGSSLSFAGTEFTAGTLVSGDSVASVTLTSAGATNTAGVGSYTINPGAATGSGLGNYNITYANGTLTVTPALLGVTANDVTNVYGATNPVFTVSYTGFVNAESLTNSDIIGAPVLTTGTTTNIPVGAYVISNILGTLASTNYAFALTNGTLTIVQAAVTVNADTQAKSYGAMDPALTYTFSPALLNGDTFRGALSRVVGEDVGSYVIQQGTLELSTNYLLNYTGTNLVITPANLTITANSTNEVFGSTLSFAGTEFTASGLQNSETIGTVTLTAGGGTGTAAPIGSYAITPSAAVGGTFNVTNYNVSYAAGTLTVTTLAVTATADAQTKVYGVTDPALTYTFSPALVGGDTFNGSLSRVTGENVGSYAVTQGTLALSTNYSLNYIGANLSITAANLTITANGASKAYGSSLSFAGTEFTAGTLVSGDSVASVTLTSAGATNTAGVGSYTINPGAATGSGLGNYNITYANGTLTVTPALLGVTANDVTNVYGATNPVFTVSYTGFVNAESLTNSDIIGAPVLTTGTTTNIPVGAYVISNILGTLASTNYAFALTNGTLTIVPALLTVTADNQSMVYGGTVPTLTASYSGFVNGDTIAVLTGAPSLTTAATSGSPLGSYDITNALGTLSASNYAVTLANGTLTITPASLTITANSTGKTYGNTLSFAGTEFGCFGLLNSDTISSVSLVANGGTNATDATGSYAITPSSATGAGLTNYNITYNAGTLTVGTLGVTVTANPQAKIYGTADPVLTYSASPALVGSDTVSGSLTRVAGENVGTYPITQGSLALSTNYALSFVGTNLTITASNLTITASNLTKYNGQTVTFAGTEFSTTPLVSGDSVTGVTLSSTGAAGTAAVGTYGIVPNAATGTGLGNYNINYANGTLTVLALGTNTLGTLTVGLPTTLTAQGIPGYTYIMQRATDLTTGTWVNVSTNTAASDGSITASDAFGDLGGMPSAQAFYRLSWQP